MEYLLIINWTLRNCDKYGTLLFSSFFSLVFLVFNSKSKDFYLLLFISLSIYLYLSTLLNITLRVTSRSTSERTLPMFYEVTRVGSIMKYIFSAVKSIPNFLDKLFSRKDHSFVLNATFSKMLCFLSFDTHLFVCVSSLKNVSFLENFALVQNR